MNEAEAPHTEAPPPLLPARGTPPSDPADVYKAKVGITPHCTVFINPNPQNYSPILLVRRATLTCDGAALTEDDLSLCTPWDLSGCRSYCSAGKKSSLQTKHVPGFSCKAIGKNLHKFMCGWFCSCFWWGVPDLAVTRCGQG